MSSGDKPIICIVDDDRSLQLEEFFSQDKFSVRRCYDVESALKALLQFREERGEMVGVVFVDIVLPIRTGEAPDPRGGIKLLDEIRRFGSSLYLVPITGKGWGTENSGKRCVLDEARNFGISEYISKPITRNEVLAIVNRTLQADPEIARQQSGSKTYAVKFAEHDIRYIVSENKEMQDRVIGRIAMDGPSRDSVLIYGETGTGKELVARALHASSGREVFQAVNCAAIPDHLIESVLFGSEGKDTKAPKKGKFELADEGTLFLDEIGDLTLSAQAKLLRVLQEGEIERVGGNQSIPIDVRIVSATNKNLEEMVRQGAFRKDLFYRLEGVEIRIPPLRDRREDIVCIAQYIIGGLNSLHVGEKQLSMEAAETLQEYHWPGNVRELQNVLRAAYSSGGGNAIMKKDLSKRILASANPFTVAIRELAGAISRNRRLTLDVANILLASEVYNLCGGKPELAAVTLGVSVNTLNKYKRSISEISAALIRTGFDEEKAAKLIPDYSVSFFRKRVLAFLAEHEFEELSEIQKMEGYPEEWLDYMRRLKSAN